MRKAFSRAFKQDNVRQKKLLERGESQRSKNVQDMLWKAKKGKRYKMHYPRPRNANGFALGKMIDENNPLFSAQLDR